MRALRAESRHSAPSVAHGYASSLPLSPLSSWGWCQSPDSSQKLLKELLGYRHLEDYLSGVANYLGPDLDQLNLDAAQRPVPDTLGQGLASALPWFCPS